MASQSLSQRITFLENNSSSTESGVATTIANVENLQTSLDSKQNQLSAGDNIIILDNVISSTGSSTSSSTTDNPEFLSVNTGTLTAGGSTFTGKIEIINAPEDILPIVKIQSELIINGGDSFDTIVLRRISGDGVMNLREVQLWINDINVLITETNSPSNNTANQPIDNTVEFIYFNDGTPLTATALQTYYASNAVNNLIPDLDTHTINNGGSSLYIPLNSSFTLDTVQSFVFYNRVGAGNFRAIGLRLEIYNRTEDPLLSVPVAVSNTITESQSIYRFDFLSIDTYNNFVSGVSTTNITSDASISTDITYNTDMETEVGVALKIEDGRLEINQEISAKNVVITDTTPTENNELTSKLYVDTLNANLQTTLDALIVRVLQLESE